MVSKNKRLYLGIDQGSSSTKGVLLLETGEVVEEFSVPVETKVVDQFRVEQNPEELRSSVFDILKKGKTKARSAGLALSGLGLACQRSGVLAWEGSSGKVLHPLISHRDTRTKPIVERIGKISETVLQKACIPVLPNYAGPKISLLQEKFQSPNVLVSTLDSYLIHTLTNFVTEDTMASRTLLYDLRTGNWDKELCSIFSVDIKRLAAIRPSLFDYGDIQGIPMLCLLGDQQASLLGSITADAKVLLNMGTISSICIFTGSKLRIEAGYIPSVFYSTSGPSSIGSRERTFFLESAISFSAGLLSLILEKLELAANYAEIERFCKESELEGDQTLAFVTLGNSGSPEFRYDLDDVIMSWDGSSKRHLVRALIENLGCALSQNILALYEKGLWPNSQKKLMVSGGISELTYLLQFISNCTGFELIKGSSKQKSARGAAMGCILKESTLEKVTLLNDDKSFSAFIPKDSKASERFIAWKTLKQQITSGGVRDKKILKLETLWKWT